MKYLSIFKQRVIVLSGLAIAQAVSHRLPTAAAQVWFQVRSCGICGGQSGTVAGFLRVLRFPLPILIPPTTPHSSSIIRDWYKSPNIGWRTKWTQSHPTPRQKKNYCAFTTKYLWILFLHVLLNATPAEALFSLPLQHKTSNKLLILWIILIYCLFLIQLLYLLEHPSVIFLAQLYGGVISVLWERLPTCQ
jgi:hypothetical protein